MYMYTIGITYFCARIEMGFCKCLCLQHIFNELSMYELLLKLLIDTPNSYISNSSRIPNTSRTRMKGLERFRTSVAVSTLDSSSTYTNDWDAVFVNRRRDRGEQQVHSIRLYRLSISDRFKLFVSGTASKRQPVLTY
jgi:hypothetical protein